jgi:hypothetical protein
MKRIMLSLMVLAMVASSASAYDFLYTRDTAMTHEAGTFGIDGTFIWFTANSFFDESGDSQDFPTDATRTIIAIPVNFYYAISDQFEVGVQPKFLMPKEEWPIGREVMEFSASGIGDTWIDAKYMFMPEPLLTARLGVKVATGDDEPADDEIATGDGQMDIDGALLFGAPAGPGMFDGALGYRHRLARSEEVGRATYDYTPGSEIHFMAGYTYFLNDYMNLRLAADGFFGGDADVELGSRETVEDSAVNAVYINPAIEYMMENGVMLGADFHYPLMGQNLHADWGFDIFLGWSM